MSFKKSSNHYFKSLFLILSLFILSCQKENQVQPEAQSLSQTADENICQEKFSSKSFINATRQTTAASITNVPFTIDSTFTVTEGISAVADRKRLKVAFEGYDGVPTGFYVEAGASVTLKVTKKTGTRYPKLVIGTLSRGYSVADENWQSSTNILEVQLTEGTNTISNTTANGGLIYLKYTYDTSPSGSTFVRFLSGMKPVPMFKRGTTTHDQWLSMLNTLNDVPDVILTGQRVIVVSSKENAVLYQNEDQFEVLKNLDRVVVEEEKMMGLDNLTALDAPRIHKMLLVQHSHPTQYLYAYYGRTAYKSTKMNTVLTVAGIQTDGWGVFHEIGHTYQQSWKWSAVVEVSNNVYSQALFRYFNIESRLKTDNRWPEVATFLATTDASRDYNASTTSYWVRLGMFQQLYLAFGDNFFVQQHKMFRQEAPSLGNDENRMRWFMLNACKVSGKNLGSFFRKWGFKVNETIYTEINALNLPAPTTDLTKLTD